MKKVAIVTGASRGIGRAIAEKLAGNRIAVAVNYRKSVAEAEQVVQGIKTNGGHAIAVKADCGNTEEIQHLFNTAQSELGPVDFIINNAGISIREVVANTSEAQFDETFRINTKAPFFIMQKATEIIRDGGSIVNISSGATHMNPPTSAIYAGSKAALDQFTRVLAKEIGARGVRVNSVSPGFTDTSLLDRQLAEEGPKMTPLGRIGRTEDIADVVSFLLSEEARWITGQIIQVNGGLITP